MAGVVSSIPVMAGMKESHVFTVKRMCLNGSFEEG